jgi:hypothetical protein
MYVDAMVMARMAELERDRNLHLAEGRKLRTLADRARDHRALRSIWQESNSAQRLRWNVAEPQGESETSAVDEAA